MDAVETLLDCGEIQKKLFFKQFLATNQIGEITCVNSADTEDSFIFERFEVNGVGLVVVFRLLSEDSVIVAGREPAHYPIDVFIASKATETLARYEKMILQLEKDGKTLADVKKELVESGRDPCIVDYRAFDRNVLEETLQPGRKRINGDRGSRLQILQRQHEIPNDLQKPALNEYVLPLPEQIKEFMQITNTEERQQWQDMHLRESPRQIDLGCHLPLLMNVVDVYPKIFKCPDKELDVESQMRG